jgi:hypothetical protein
VSGFTAVVLLVSGCVVWAQSSGSATASEASVHNRIVPVVGSVSPAMDETSTETPPHAELTAPAGAFVVPPGTTSVQVSVAPIEPPMLSPSSGRIDGDVYHFEVTAGLTPLAPAPGHRVTISLLGSGGTSAPSLEAFDATSPHPWTPLATRRVPGTGGDRYAADVDALGDFALVVAQNDDTDHPTGGGGHGAVIGVAVVGFVASAGVLGWRRGWMRRPGAGSSP